MSPKEGRQMEGNTFVLTGNVVATPELRHTGNSIPLVEFSIARSWSTGPDTNTTHYFDFTAWRSLAENVAATLTKGMRVTVTGVIRQSRWVDADGKNRSRLQLEAREVAPSLVWQSAAVTKNPREDMADSTEMEIVEVDDLADVF